MGNSITVAQIGFSLTSGRNTILKGETALDQQKILGYFIEEAKEHLETLESGILELSSVVGDQERVNEMFRAAHSIKGGAAMLGYGSIQKISHRLEDAFKILREHKITVDQKLESLFFKGYDVLQDLVEKLQSPFGLQAEEADVVVEKAQPTFVELQAYLNQLLEGGIPGTESVATGVPAQVRSLLKQMLAVFKQPSTPDSRQSLQQLCQQLAKLVPQEPNWQTLVKVAQTAIANPLHSYRTLAPVVIKNLKQGSDLMELGRAKEIAPSQGLQQLATTKLPQMLVSVEPSALVAALRQVFNPKQLSQVIKLLGANS